VDLVRQVGVAFHIITAIISFIIATGSIIPDDRLFELETLGQARLSQFKKDKADTFTVASLELVWVNIDF